MADIAYVYIADGMSDWELGFITPEINTSRYFKQGREPYVVKTFGLRGDPVATMGGLRILPDLVIDEVSTQQAALLLLPGSDTYHILTRLDVFTADTLDAWYKLYVSHEPHHFFQLMQLLPQQISA
jgi:hypothetical protein